MLALMPLSVSCTQKVEHNTLEMTDPWLRDRTVTSFKLVGQVGPSIISTSWRDDDKGSIKLNLIVNAVDLHAVMVDEISFRFGGEYAPKASVKAGDTIDLSSGSGEFTVTAYNGETRTYTISFDSSELFSGTFTMVAEKSSLGWGDATYLTWAGGKDEDVRTGNIYDHKGDVWNYAEHRWPNDELDNTISFKQTYFDPDIMVQYGSLVNYSGEDGLWADFVYKEILEDTSTYEKDVNSIYRLLPKGKSRWANAIGSDTFTFYEYSDDLYANPICEATILYQGSYEISYPGATIASWCPGAISVGSVAFTRVFPHSADVDMGDAIASFMVENIRQVWWKLIKVSDECLDNHDELIASY